MALAIEFPRIQFVLTDLLDRDAGYPNYHRAMDMAWKWRLENIQFSVWNVLEPTKRSFDMVVSTEMLEHIKDDETASLNMRKAAKKYVYCLVPFADANTNCDPARRSYVLSKFGHHVSGYDEKRLVELFPRPMFVYGTYWSGSGQAFRQRLTEMSDLEISSQQKQLEKMAKDDLISVQPIKSSEAQGIKILSHC